MDDPYYVRIVIWCQGTMISTQEVDRRTNYDSLLQLLSDATGLALNQYSFKVSAKLGDDNTSQFFHITSDRVLRYFFDPAQNLRTVELFVDVEALPPRPYQFQIEELSMHYPPYNTAESVQPDFANQNYLPGRHSTAGTSTGVHFDAGTCRGRRSTAEHATGRDFNAGPPTSRHSVSGSTSSTRRRNRVERRDGDLLASSQLPGQTSVPAQTEPAYMGTCFQQPFATLSPEVARGDIDQIDSLIDRDSSGSELSHPRSGSSDEETVIPSNVRIAPHPTLSRAPFFDSSYGEVDMDSVGMPTGNFTYDEAVGILNKGMIFPDKEHLKAAVNNYSIVHAMREYYVLESTPAKWKVACKSNQHSTGQQCNWYLRASQGKNKGFWKITKLGDHHSCLIPSTKKRHGNLDRNVVAELLEGMVKVDPAYTAKCAQEMVSAEFHYDITYNMAWKAIRRAIENVYGTWESSCAFLPKFMMAIQHYNTGTVVEWRHKENQPRGGVYTLGYMFWAFRPVIDAWRHCRNVITVDGTHLYTKYKHKLLIAIGVDANQEILPLAYAIVDEESYDSWSWFLKCLSWHIIRDVDGVCVISDRHAGLLKAVAEMEEFNEPRGVHRYCLRHVASNFNKQFKNLELKDMVMSAGKATTTRRWKQIMEQIKLLKIEAYEWLTKLDREKWTMCYDNGRRYGVMTTNLSECFNGVLVGARRLPITAIVRITFHRLKKYFMEREVAARRIQRANHGWPDGFRKKFLETQQIALAIRHNVDPHNIVAQSASVSSVHPGSRRTYTHRVELANQSCSCGQWLLGSVPCSHAMAVCRHFGYDPATFVDQCYSAQTYFATYTAGRFWPLADEAEWEEPNFRLQHNPARRVTRRRRGANTRIHNEMDWAQDRARQQYQARNAARGGGEVSSSRRI